MLLLRYIGPLVCVLVMTTTLGSPAASSDEALAAVAANFAEASEDLKRRFESESPHVIKLVSGSTGQLYAQIINGAPFDLLLAADQTRPLRLINEDRALAESRFTYATGTLALWSADNSRVGKSAIAILETGDFRILAIANPDLAPYGAAARQLLLALGLAQSLQDKIVQGQNVGQTFSMVATGNAELGLVSLSHVLSKNNQISGSLWDIPNHLYAPIRQDAVLLSRGADNPAAVAFYHFLKGREARSVIASYGYGSE